MIRTETLLDLRGRPAVRLEKVLAVVPGARAESVSLRVVGDDPSVVIIDTDIESLSHFINRLQEAFLSAVDALGMDTDGCELSLCTIDGDGHVLALRDAWMSANKAVSA